LYFTDAIPGALKEQGDVGAGLQSRDDLDVVFEVVDLSY